MKEKTLTIVLNAVSIALFAMAIINFCFGHIVSGLSNIIMACAGIILSYCFYKIDLLYQVLKAVGRKVFHLPAEDSDSDVIPEEELTEDEKRVKRMAEEYDQLVGRYNRLCNFIESDKFKTLSEESQFLLTQQKDAMTDYVKILRQRIELECENANLKAEYPSN